jgi:transposase-like protein
VFHSRDGFVRGKNSVNGTEDFRSLAKRRLAKFNGCTSDKFMLHLRECKFRYNHHNEDLLPIVKNL